MKHYQTVHLKMQPEPFIKNQNNYLRLLKDSFRTSISRVVVQQYIYYVSFVAKKSHLFYDDCQLLAYIDQKHQHYLALAFQSNGFPYDSDRHPILEQRCPFDKIKNVSVSGHQMTIELQHENKPWVFRFSEETLAQEWLGLLAQLEKKHKRLSFGSNQGLLEIIEGRGNSNCQRLVIIKNSQNQEPYVSTMGQSSVSNRSNRSEDNELRNQLEQLREREIQLQRERKQHRTLISNQVEEIDRLSTQLKMEVKEQLPLSERELINNMERNLQQKERTIKRLVKQNRELKVGCSSSHTNKENMGRQQIQ